MITYEFLQNYWWLLISILGAVLVFLLFVQGGQTMLLTTKEATYKSMMVNSLGRKWELTFTTLVVFGGAFFASFPLFYSTSFGGAYWLWMIILFSFIVQAISYKYRQKEGNVYGTRTYDTLLFINGIIGPVLLGVAVAMMFFGAEFTVSKANILEEDIDFCLRMTEKELRGDTLTQEEYMSIQKMGSSIEWFTLSVIEPGVSYNDLDDVQGASRSIALVSDVFTRNIDGCDKNGVLHEATGTANVIYVLVDIGGQTYLTRGATFGYYEFVRPLGERLTDEEWQKMLREGQAPEMPVWIRPYFLTQPPTVDETLFYSSGC